MASADVPTSPEAVQVVLARHAETPWTLLGRHTGRTDISLTEQGRAVARSRRHDLGSQAFALVLCSPLVRARETAELLGWAHPELDADLVEWDYGDLEGLTRPEILERHPGWDLWRQGAPGGESPADVTARVDRVVARLRATPGPTLVVAHGHLLRTLAARWIQQPLPVAAHLPLDPGASATLGVDRGTPVLRRWNELGGDPPQRV